MNSSQDQPPQEGASKKSPLENLSREELIKKCKGLLGLAQKAKQAKDEFAEENKKLKEELNKFETQKEADKKSLMAMKEMVDAFSESKLSQTSKIADLEAQAAKLEKEIKLLTHERNQLSELSIQNESLKRQVQRLSDENEELLTNLDNMEKKLEQVNQFGMQQQKDLILLEEATVKWEVLETSLRNKLKEYEEEISLLKGNISKLEEDKYNLLNSVESEDNKKLIVDLKAENMNLQNQIEDLKSKFNSECSKKDDSTSEDWESLKNKCKHYEELCAKQADELGGIRKSSELQNSKNQNIKVKLVEVTMKLKKLKKSKQVLADAVQEYYVSIPKWQKEVQRASDMLCLQLNSLGNAKKDLESKVSLLETELRTITVSKAFYENRLEDLIECCNKVLIEENESFLSQNNGKSAELKDISVNTEINTDASVDLVKELEASLRKANDDYEKSCKHLSIMQEDFNKQSIILEDVKSELKSVQEAFDSERKIREEIEFEYEKIKNNLCDIKEENKNIATEKENSKENLERLQAALTIAEDRHADLLSEMRELNEALKGRGDVISRQQDKIVELEKEIRTTRENLSRVEVNLSEKENLIAEKEVEINKMSKEISEAKDEVSSLAHQARESEKVIKNLSEEVTYIRDRACDTQSEVLSTSTVSRAEECTRMREVDESFEEKYNKLRTLAIKLKKKVQEQAQQIAILESDNKKNFEEKNEIRTKLGTINVQVKNLQALQNENDKLLDVIEKVKKEKDNAEKQIKELSEKIQSFATSGTTTDNAIQEYQNQIKFLKQEKESFNLVRRDWEKEREVLKAEVISKEKELNTLRLQNEKIKTELEKCKAAGKQSNVLNLEIEAYEKSLNEATQNLKIKETLIKDLQENLKNKDEFIESNKKEIKLLEESLESERGHSSGNFLINFL